MAAVSGQNSDLVVSCLQILSCPAPAIGLRPFPRLFVVDQEPVEDPIIIRVQSHCFPEDRCPLFQGALLVGQEALQNWRPVWCRDGNGGIHGVVKGVKSRVFRISCQDCDLMVARSRRGRIPDPGIGWRPIIHYDAVFQEFVVYLVAVGICSVGSPLVAQHRIGFIGCESC